MQKKFRYIFYGLGIYILVTLLTLLLDPLFDRFIYTDVYKKLMYFYPLEPRPEFNLAEEMVSELMRLLITLIMIRLWCRENILKLVFGRKSAIRLILIGLIVSALPLGVDFALDKLHARIFSEPSLYERFFKETVEFVIDSGQILWFLIYVSILVPIDEELFFRGFLYNISREHMPRFIAVAFSASIFTFFHFDPRVFVATFFVGVVLAYLYEFTGALLPCIVLHSVVNFLSTMLYNKGGM